MNTAKKVLGEDGDILYDRNFQIILLTYMLGIVGVPIFSPLLESLTVSYGISEVQVGLLMTIYTAPGIVLIPVFGYLSDRYGRKPMLVLGLVTFGSAGVAMAFTSDFTHALALRFVQGVGFSSIVPVAVTSVGDLYEGSRLTAGQGILASSIAVTQTILPIAAGYLVELNWRYPMALFLLSFPVALGVLLALDEPAKGAKKSETVAIWPYIHRLATAPHIRKVSLLVIGFGIAMFTYISFLTYNSIAVSIEGWQPGIAGILAGLGGLASGTIASQSGRVAQAVNGRINTLVLSNIAMGTGFVVFILTSGLFTTLLGALILGAGFGISLSMYRGLLTETATEELRGGIVSLAESNGRIGATLSPILLGAIISYLASSVGYTTAVQYTLIGTGIGCGTLGTLIAVTLLRFR